MPPSLNRELAGTVLVSAAFTTDDQACEQYGVSLRSLQRWRRQLADGDPELAGIVSTKKAAFDKAWADDLPAALKRGISCLAECFETVKADPESHKNPAIIRAIAGAMSAVADIEITGRVIDARIGRGGVDATGGPLN